MSDVNVERRGAPRARADLPLRLSADAAAEPASLRDISTSGLCCDFPQPLQEMTLLRISLELPGASSHALQGVVVRCGKRRGVKPPTYEVAVYFTDMEPETRAAIQRFVTERL